MKKILFVAAMTGMLVACNGGSNNEVSNAESDSLRNVINQKEGEIEEFMDAFNEIQEGFDRINEAQGRVNLLKGNSERGKSAEDIRENMDFIQKTLLENQQKISELQKKLNASSSNYAKLQETLKKMTEQLEEKTAEIEALRTQLAEKDVVIEELGNTVNELKDENEQVRQQKEETEEIARVQDVQLNTAWYVYGTSRELKDHGILKKGEVLQGTYDKSYFTKIDIRNVSVIPLQSKSAELLTTHPTGSYTLLKDSNGKYTLRITDASKFWSVSKYLVVKVK
ncbi:MAG: hypothetical protein MJZ41_04125 [Bacteroidaceae bacterium]|nr:hypothetical protein [Bacteroidaceae bacterium]